MKLRNWRLGSACVSHAGDGVLAVANFFDVPIERTACVVEGKSVAAGRRNQHARRVRYPEGTLHRAK